MTDTPSTKQIFPALLLATFLLPAVVPAQDSPPSGPRTVRRAPAEGVRIWWNQPRFVEGLKLTEEQRQGMDAVLKTYQEARQEAGRAYQASRAALMQSAQAGDWTATEAANAGLGEASAELARLEGTMVVDVLRLMSAEQRAKLKDEFPLVLRRPWIFGGAAGVRGGGRRSPG